jgi:hypothetical protein
LYHTCDYSVDGAAVSQMSSLDSARTRRHGSFTHARTARGNPSVATDGTDTSAKSISLSGSALTGTPASTVPPLALFTSPVTSFPLNGGDSLAASESTSPLHSARFSNRSVPRSASSPQQQPTLARLPEAGAQRELAATRQYSEDSNSNVLEALELVISKAVPQSPSGDAHQKASNASRGVACTDIPRPDHDSGCNASKAQDEQALRIEAGQAHQHSSDCQVGAGSMAHPSRSDVQGEALFSSTPRTSQGTDVDADSVASLGSYLTNEHTPVSVSLLLRGQGGRLSTTPEATPDTRATEAFNENFTFSRHASSGGHAGAQVAVAWVMHVADLGVFSAACERCIPQCSQGAPDVAPEPGPGLVSHALAIVSPPYCHTGAMQAAQKACSRSRLPRQSLTAHKPLQNVVESSSRLSLSHFLLPALVRSRQDHCACMRASAGLLAMFSPLHC